VETAQLLLKAGSAIKIKDRRESENIALLLKSVIITNPFFLSIFKDVFLYRNRIQICVVLTELLLKYETCPIPILNVLQSAKVLAEVCEAVNNRNFLYQYDRVIDMLGDIVRNIALAQVDGVADELEDKMGGAEDIFIDSFVSIMEYSSQPKRSKKLVYMIPNALNASTVNRWTWVLSERLRAMTESTPANCLASTSAALKCIRDIETPFSLQRLCRREINRAMSTGELKSELLSGGELPVHLKKYVLHQE